MTPEIMFWSIGVLFLAVIAVCSSRSDRPRRSKAPEKSFIGYDLAKGRDYSVEDEYDAARDRQEEREDT